MIDLNQHYSVQDYNSQNGTAQGINRLYLECRYYLQSLECCVWVSPLCSQSCQQMTLQHQRNQFSWTTSCSGWQKSRNKRDSNKYPKVPLFAEPASLYICVVVFVASRVSGKSDIKPVDNRISSALTPLEVDLRST